jgi:hypothetical protein
MSADDLPCRRCGEIAGDLTRLWRPGPGGALAPFAAQHRTPCAAARPAALVIGTAARPGPCSACTREIAPGDKIARADEIRVFHFECAPAESPQAQSQRRERARTHRQEGRRGAVWCPS